MLLLSCINNLSRIELALPKEVADARIQVSIRHETQFWRSDDHGVLFSSARGMPAIEMMKLAASESRLLLRSNAPLLTGYSLILEVSMKPLMLCANAVVGKEPVWK